jgi:hypothetical protein
METKDFINNFRRHWSHWCFNDFCRALGFDPDPKLSEKYWEAFRKLAEGIGTFDNGKLNILFGNDSPTPTKSKETHDQT